MAQIEFRSVEEADVEGKRVLVRLDLNVPMDGDRVTDATRIERALPTLRLLGDRGAKTIILAHLGRPKGQRVDSFSLAPVAKTIDGMGGVSPVHFASECIGEVAEQAVDALAPGEFLVLENLRFHAQEEKNDPNFVAALAKLGDVYVNDAFSVSHRAHASTEGIAHKLPAYAGLQMAAELAALSGAVQNPERPVAAVVGGAKISTKIDVLNNLAGKYDALIIGGAMANTFLHAKGVDVGKSLCEDDLADTARAIMETAKASGCKLLLPEDAVVAKEFKAGAPSTVCALDQVPDDSMILDVGPATVRALTERLGDCKTLLWNGPMGAFEVDPFGEGTFSLAREAARLTRNGTLVTVAGGGDTVAALNAADVADDFSYVSTAGGAFLEWLEGKELPGVAVLQK